MGDFPCCQSQRTDSRGLRRPGNEDPLSAPRYAEVGKEEKGGGVARMRREEEQKVKSGGEKSKRKVQLKNDEEMRNGSKTRCEGAEP